MTACGTDTAPSQSPDTPAIAGERLLATPPPEWTRTFELDEAGIRLVEFMPRESDPEQWVDKISFESFTADGTSDAGELPDPITLVRNIAEERERACSGFDDYNTFSGLENNYPTSVRLLLCHRNKSSGRGEITMLKSVQGNNHFYVIQRARQVEPFEGQQNAPMKNEEMGLWSLYFRSISVCDDSRPEHRCPASEPADSS